MAEEIIKRYPDIEDHDEESIAEETGVLEHLILRHMLSLLSAKPQPKGRK